MDLWTPAGAAACERGEVMVMRWYWRLFTIAIAAIVLILGIVQLNGYALYIRTWFINRIFRAGS